MASRKTSLSIVNKSTIGSVSLHNGIYMTVSVDIVKTSNDLLFLDDQDGMFGQVVTLPIILLISDKNSDRGERLCENF